MRDLLLLIFFCSIKIYSWADDGIKYTSIDNNDGLSHNTVRHIMQDSKGFMWISTVNGLNRYDGKQFVIMQPEFKTHSLTENTIKKTVEDKNGYVWVLSASDFVDCYDTHTESFISYSDNASKTYNEIVLSSLGDVWLYGQRHGACRIQYIDNQQVATHFNVQNIESNTINFIHEDSRHNIWIGTEKALFKIHNNRLIKCRSMGKNKSYKHAAESNEKMYFFCKTKNIIVFDIDKERAAESISFSPKQPFHVNKVRAIEKDKILIAGKEGIKMFNTASKQMQNTDGLNKKHGFKNADLHIDNIGNCWIFNNTGTIWLYDKTHSSFKSYELIPSAILALIDLERYDLYVDSNGMAWISTYGNGLFRINLNTNEITHLTTENSVFKTNYLLSVFEDRDENIWVGTQFTGITRLSFPKNKLTTFIPPSPEKSKESRIVRSVFEDKQQNIWMGTKNGNVYLYDKDNKHLNTIHLPKGIPYYITDDKDGNIWVATKGGGITHIHKQGTRYTTKTYNSNTVNALETDNIYTITCDSKNRMWIGTFGSGLVLGEKINDTYQFTNFPYLSEVQNKIRCIIEDSSGNMWIGGNNGLIKLYPDDFLSNNNNFTHIVFDKNTPTLLSNNEIKTIHEDANKKIWIGTSGSGISLIDKNDTKQLSLKHFSTKDGLVNNVVQSITSDKDNNIWISTEAGLSKLNATTKIFENFNFSDNWTSNLFCESAAIKKQNGELLFGSHNGLYTINPDKMTTKKTSTPITLTKLTINGNLVTPNTEKSPLTKSISETSSITLNHTQNTFSIEFASLRFGNSHTNRYSYTLENFDNNWTTTTDYNVANYKKLTPGKYVFKVKEYHAGSSKPSETALSILITPPFWKTRQAFGVYFMILILIIYFAAKLFSKMNRLNNGIHIEKQITEYKLKFFTNISHEFRTPLTIIRVSIENMRNINSTSQKLKKQINLLDQSSLRLMNLIDQLLEFRRLQNKQLDLNVSPTNAYAFFHNIYTQFKQIAESKNINYTFDFKIKPTDLPLDGRKVDKITFNLLSNAFRNTPAKGHIKLQLSTDDVKNHFTFCVSDSGPGIPADKVNSLFVRFKSADYNSTGMGIGLNLTQELVQIHRGEIRYSTSEWGGASFSIILPLSYPDLEMAEHTEHKEHKPQLFKFEEDNNRDTPVKKPDYHILIIEDDNEIRYFLSEQLANSFSVLSANNGVDGLQKAQDNPIDLVICDVMMPEMNGYELTKKLKADFETSHIPVILLTSCASLDEQIEGIDAGADAYITKPFSFKYLYSRIIKLIEQREKLKFKLDNSNTTIKPTITTGEKDKAFIEKVNQLIEEEMTNHKFNVESFANSLNISRTLFYKKTKKLTGYAPIEYIRLVRLKKSADLLTNTDLNVSEVAYQVGFNDPFYFSKCFKEEFKLTPSEYRADKHET